MNVIVEEFIKQGKIQKIASFEIRQVKKTLDAFDTVNLNFEGLKETLNKVLTTIIFYENKIHVKVEQRRKWDTSEYKVVKFDYFDNELSVKIRSSIKSEFETGAEDTDPVIKISKDFLLNADSDEFIEQFYADYEAELVKKIEEKNKKAAESVKIAEAEFYDFQRAKELYLSKREHFKKLEEKILPFEEWRKRYFSTFSADDPNMLRMAHDMQNFHGINLENEINALAKIEYDRYVLNVMSGID